MFPDKLPFSKDYLLRISAGPDENHLTVISVNDEHHPFYMNGPNFTGYLLVRVSGFKGISPLLESTGIHAPIYQPTSGYFSGRTRKYSIVIQGRFKQEWVGDDVVFGVDSNLPLYPIPGVGFGIRLCKWLDPALEADLTGSCPHIYSPIISSMNAMAIYRVDDDCTIEKMTKGKVIGEGVGGMNPTRHDQARVVYPIPSIEHSNPIVHPNPIDHSDPIVHSNPIDHFDHPNPNPHPNHIDHSIPSLETLNIDNDFHDPPFEKSSSNALDVKEFAFGNANVPENSRLLFTDPADADYATTYEKRKKLFGSPEKRMATRISPSHLYCLDFYDAYFDLSQFTVKVPGFSISAFKYWDGVQPLRYRCLTRDGRTVFFCIQFDLIPKSKYFSAG